MDASEHLATQLGRRVGGIVDPELRATYVGHALREIDPTTAADVLTRAIHGTEARDHQHGALLLAASVALANVVNEGLRASVVSAALGRGQIDTARMLQPQPPVRMSEDDERVPDFGIGRPISLGERKSLARGRNRDLLARIIRDPHPDVIQILLKNPTLTEADLVRLCARRPISGDVMREVLRSARWMVRYRVRHVMVRNPFTPVDVALQLAMHLSAPDAREVYGSGELAESVRLLCRRIAGLGTMH